MEKCQVALSIGGKVSGGTCCFRWHLVYVTKFQVALECVRWHFIYMATCQVALGIDGIVSGGTWLCQGMCLQITRFSETLITLLTSERLLPTAYSDMFLQTTRCSESLLTLLISIRLLPNCVFGHISVLSSLDRFPEEKKTVFQNKTDFRICFPLQNMVFLKCPFYKKIVDVFF